MQLLEREVRVTWQDTVKGEMWVSTATIQRSTYFMGGQAVATRVSGDPDQGNNGLFFLHVDHLGSTSFLTDAVGNKRLDTVVRYYPFGEYRTTPSVELTEMGFTGHHENRYIKLIYMGARWYLPGTGRFLSADSIVPEPANPQSLNRYSYVNNKTLSYKDPSGHCAGFINQPDAPDYDEECWEYLLNEFCGDGLCDSWQDWVIVGWNSIWVKHDLELLREALLATRSALSDLGIDLRSAVGLALRFRRVNVGTMGEAAARFWADNAGNYGIELADAAFAGSSGCSSAACSLHKIVHEIGHAINYQVNGQLAAMYPGNLAKGSSWDLEMQTSIGYFYRMQGRSITEGWADAFAAWVFQHRWGRQPYEVVQSGYPGYIDTQYFQDQRNWYPIYDAVRNALIVSFGS
jgi:RHS repeat-associated protein